VTNLSTWGRGVNRRLSLRDIPGDVLDQVTVRDGLGCTFCRYLGLTAPDDEPLELDHIQPLALGGDYHWSNLRWLCRSHNRMRGARRRPRSVPPTWLLRLAQAGQLEAHVNSCVRQGRLWSPVEGRLLRQVSQLLHGRVS